MQADMPRTQSRLRTLIAFDRQFRRDQSQSPVFLHRRDRRFALDCQARGEIPTAGLWLNRLQRVGRPGAEQTAVADHENHILSRWQRLFAGFCLAGLVLGSLTMAGLLYYEGGQRINLTILLAFVGLQTLLALITVGQSLMNGQPWRRVLRRLGLSGPDSPLAPLAPTLVSRAAHAGGLCFGLAGVATLLVLVVLEDLAFGWSTTLDTSGEGYHRLLSALAWPWQQIWPAAAPDLSLVEATRFFRAGSDSGSTDPARWGQWWPFVTMLWVTYVILPRLAGLLVAQALLARRARIALARHPGMVALEYRMETPTVETGNASHDADDAPDEQTAAQCQALPDSQVLLFWAGADKPELPDSLTAGHLLTASAGGERSLEDDQHTIEQCAEILEKQARPAVTLVTRAWEPPIGELADFIHQALECWPEKTRLALLPLASDPTRPASTRQLAQWLRFAERLGDQRICVSQPDLQSPQSRAYETQPEAFR